MEIRYFVSYAFNTAGRQTGFGNAQIVADRAVQSWEDMTDLVADVAKVAGEGITPDKVVILNVQRFPL